MKTVSPWAAQFLTEEPELIDVTPPSQKPGFFAQASLHVALRNEHAQALRNRLLNTVGAFALSVFVPFLMWLTLPIAIGWAIAAGISLYGLVCEQMALSITVED